MTETDEFVDRLQKRVLQLEGEKRDAEGPAIVKARKVDPWSAHVYTRRVRDVARAVRQELRKRGSGEAKDLTAEVAGEEPGDGMVGSVLIAEGLAAVATELARARRVASEFFAEEEARDKRVRELLELYAQDHEGKP